MSKWYFRQLRSLTRQQDYKTRLYHLLKAFNARMQQIERNYNVAFGNQFQIVIKLAFLHELSPYNKFFNEMLMVRLLTKVSINKTPKQITCGPYHT